LSFFVSKNIESILDEETLRNQSGKEETAEASEFCQLVIDKEENSSFFKIKKIKFLKSPESKKVVEVNFNCRARLVGSIVSNKAIASEMLLGSHSVKIASGDILSIESSGIGEYSVVISCLLA
jgi:hypothetical protein